MNYNELWNEISNSLFTHVKNLISKAPYDKTFKAKVLKKLSDGKYQILYKNTVYTVRYNGLVNIGDTVHVCAPKNNWSELFILDWNHDKFKSASLADVTAEDTKGALGVLGAEVSAQYLVDWIADQAMNQLLKKTDLVNNALATTAGLAALDAAMGKYFGDKINSIEGNLSYGYCSDMNLLFSSQYYGKICLFKIDGATTNRPRQMGYGDGYIISYCILDWCVQHVYSVGTYENSTGVYKRVYDARTGWGQWYDFSELRVVSNTHNTDIVYENYSFGYIKSGIGILNVDCYYRANVQWAEFKLLDTDFRPWQFTVGTLNDEGEPVQIIVRNDGSINLYNRNGAIGENRILRIQLVLNS